MLGLAALMGFEGEIPVVGHWVADADKKVEAVFPVPFIVIQD